jgi:hypothetical protein
MKYFLVDATLDQKPNILGFAKVKGDTFASVQIQSTNRTFISRSAARVLVGQFCQSEKVWRDECWGLGEAKTKKKI